MSDHHAPGYGGRARGVLEQGERIELCTRVTPVSRQFVEFLVLGVGDQPMQALKLGHSRLPALGVLVL